MKEDVVTIINSGASNVRGINNAVQKLGYQTRIVSSPSDFQNTRKVILPGVGAFDAAMSALNGTGLSSLIKDLSESGTHVLGICLGMQLLMEGSAEGNKAGLELFKGFVEPIRRDEGLRVPHLGWNDVIIKESNPLVGLEDSLRFYFNHSYAIYDMKDEESMLEAIYGDRIVVGIRRDSIFGVQFHPEKSHNQGRMLIKHFLEF